MIAGSVVLDRHTVDSLPKTTPSLLVIRRPYQTAADVFNDNEVSRGIGSLAVRASDEGVSHQLQSHADTIAAIGSYG